MLSPTRASALCEGLGGVGEAVTSGGLSNMGWGHFGFGGGAFGTSLTSFCLAVG
jgi:hypothetical protein